MTNIIKIIDSISIFNAVPFGMELVNFAFLKIIYNTAYDSSIIYDWFKKILVIRYVECVNMFAMPIFTEVYEW